MLRGAVIGPPPGSAALTEVLSTARDRVSVEVWWSGTELSLKSSEKECPRVGKL